MSDLTADGWQQFPRGEVEIQVIDFSERSAVKAVVLAESTFTPFAEDFLRVRSTSSATQNRETQNGNTLPGNVIEQNPAEGIVLILPRIHNRGKTAYTDETSALLDNRQSADNQEVARVDSAGLEEGTYRMIAVLINTEGRAYYEIDVPVGLIDNHPQRFASATATIRLSNPIAANNQQLWFIVMRQKSFWLESGPWIVRTTL
jgi:hypothetical protein